MAGLPGGVLFALALAAAAVVGAAQGHFGPGRDLSPLHVLPVAFAAWYLGRAGGLAIALAGTVAWWAADGLTRPVAASPAARLVDASLELALLALVALLVASRRALGEREAVLAWLDPLTGLANRQGFLEAARREVARARRSGGALTLVLVDVDRFQEVNARRGQEAADALLRGLAAALRSALRAVDVCARVGADELAALVPDPEPAAVEPLLERLRLVLAQAAAEKETPVTLSLAAVTFERPPDVDAMLREAGRRLDELKAQGGNALRHHTEAAAPA